MRRVVGLKLVRVAVALLSTMVLVYAILATLAKPQAALSIPLAGTAVAVSKRRPELAALLALLACAPLLPGANLLEPFGPLKPMPSTGGGGG